MRTLLRQLAHMILNATFKILDATFILQENIPGLLVEWLISGQRLETYKMSLKHLVFLDTEVFTYTYIHTHIIMIRGYQMDIGAK